MAGLVAKALAGNTVWLYSSEVVPASLDEAS